MIKYYWKYLPCIIIIWISLVNSMNTNSPWDNSTIHNHNQSMIIHPNQPTKPQVYKHIVHQLQETRPLISVLNQGVPISYQNPHVELRPIISALSIPLDESEKIEMMNESKKYIVITKTITRLSTLITGLPDKLELIAEDKHTSIELIHDDEQTVTKLEYNETPINRSINIETLTRNQARDQVALEEIKRLESLLLDLKKDMLRQQEKFRLQLLSMAYASTEHQDISKTSTEVTSTENIDEGNKNENNNKGQNESASLQTHKQYENEHGHGHGKNHVLNQKNPSHSVLIVPQFQHHNADHQQHNSGIGYAKPKIVYTGNGYHTLILSTISSSNTADFYNNFPDATMPTKTIANNLKPGFNIIDEVFETDGLSFDLEEFLNNNVDPALIFHVPKQLLQENNKVMTGINPLSTGILMSEDEEEDDLEQRNISTSSRRPNNRFVNHNLSIDFDVFRIDILQNNGSNIYYCIVWLWIFLLLLLLMII